MTKKRIVIVGSSFAGLPAAVRIKQQLGDQHDVLVLSKSDEFLFMPSLIWVPFGLRTKEEITFPVRPLFKQNGIDFRCVEVTGLNLPAHEVITAGGVEPYDYLVIATGPKLDFAAVPGLGPHGGYTQSICCWEDAVLASQAFEKFVSRSGRVVVGAVQGASLFGAAYEFLFNLAFQLKRRGMRQQAPLTFITAEPYLGHFGLGGIGASRKLMEDFFQWEGISAVTNAAVREIKQGEITLADGRVFPFAYGLLIPSFLGADAVRACTEITTPAGFVKVNDCYQTEVYPEVFAAGVAVEMSPPAETPVPCGVPKLGYLSDQMAKIVAHNVVASIRGEPLLSVAPGSIDAKWVLDAGNTGVIMTADHFLEPGKHAWLLPGPEAHWAKLTFEKYFMTTHRRGWI